MNRPNLSWVRAYTVVRSALPQLILYDLVFKVVGLVLLTPLTVWTLENLLARSGALAVTNADIAGFLPTPSGLLFLVSAGTLTLTTLFAEQGGLMRITAAADHDRKLHWLTVLADILRSLPRLLGTAFAQAGLILLIILPLAAVGALTYLGLLTGQDINWYLTERPPAFWVAITIGLVLAGIGLVLLSLVLVRWSLSVPVTLHEGLTGFKALRRSRALVASNSWRVARLVLGWILLTTIVSASLIALFGEFAELLLKVFPGTRAQILITAILLGVLTLTSALLSFVAYAGYSWIVVRLYLELAGEQVDADLIEQPSAIILRNGPTVITVGLVLALGVAALMTHRLIEDLALGRAVQVTAHRGSSVLAPENTLSAIRQAIEDGADYAEIDVQETADGKLVLLHDSDLLRVTGTPHRIWEVGYAEIADLDAGSWFSAEFANERIPTLAETIEIARGQIQLNIELKYNGHDQQLAERVVAAVRDADFTDQCIITSLDYSGLQTVRQIAPELKVGQIVTVAIGDPKHLDVDLLSMEARRATPQAVRANRAAGLETHVWTVNDRAQMQRMIERGVTNIITDDPVLLRSVIDERSQHSDAELLLLALSAQLKE
ncbi:MAG: glycerophosphodiester phosphodiesterase [Candidatus Competibacteraceae bacterium]|nr:glycerophosphodiester phosphodiesterase [Candidatus Competibacteraceae bacterium]